MKPSGFHRLTSIKVRDFAPTFITGLVAVAVLGYAHIGAGVQGQGKHIGKIDHSKGVTNILALEKGNYVVQFADDRLVKFGPRGKPLWEIPLDSLEGFPPVAVLSIAVEPFWDILVLGITPDTKTMTLYRVAGGNSRGPAVSLLGQYPGFSPSWVASAPDGTTYLIAHRQEALHQAVAGPLPDLHVELPIHQLDSQGQIVRSFGSMSHRPVSVQDLADFLTLTVSRRMVFSPTGSAYLVDSDAFELERVDLDTGELTGIRIRLGAGAPAQHANLDGLLFLDDSSVLYTVARLENAKMDHLGRTVVATPAGWEVRIADLEEGSSLRVASSKTPGNVAALSLADLQSVVLVNNFEPYAGHAQQEWGRFDLLQRLARQR